MIPEFDISISIVSTNEKHYIEPLLETLYDSLTREHSIEIILIDNNSTDSLNEIKSKNYPNLNILRNNDRKTFPENHNIGINAAKGKYILVLNPDILFEKTEPCIDKMIDFMDRNPHCGVSGCRVYNFNKEYAFPARRFFTLPIVLSRRIKLFHSKTVESRYLYKENDIYATFECEWLSGCFLLFRREALNDSGLFDTGYKKYFEDTEICYRIGRKGWKIIYYGQTYYFHLEQRASKKLFSKDALNIIKGYFRFIFYTKRKF
jgi:GT2 family glycosyltransferase